MKKRNNPETYICLKCGKISSSPKEDLKCYKCGSQMTPRESPKEGDWLIPLRKRGKRGLFKGFGVPS